MKTSLVTESFSHTKALLYRPAALQFLVACLLLLISCVMVNAQSGRRSPQGRPTANGGGTGGSTTQSMPRGQSTISGRIIYEETGEPVAGARVRISSRNETGRMETVVVTNGRGEFRFDNLAAGDYYVIAMPRDAAMVGAATFALPLPSGDPQRDEAAFAEARRGSDVANSTGTVEVSVDGKNNATVEVLIPRPPKGSRISGRILYEDGRPAANAQVTFLNRKEIRGRMTGPTKLSVLTDERGFYSIKGVPPGEYILSARFQEKVYIDKEGRTYGGLVLLSYYPSATSSRAASPLNVSADQEISDINITLVKRNAHKITGVLRSRSGRPLSGILVRLRNRDDLDLPFTVSEDDRFTPTDQQGRFAFNNVLDGDYMIIVGGATSSLSSLPPPRGMIMSQGGSRADLPVRPRGAPQVSERFSREAARGLIEKQQEVTVAGADISNLMIEVSEGGRVNGTITVEGDGPLPPRVIIASSMRTAERRPSAMARVNPDGTFVMSGVPDGPLSLDVLITPPGRFYVKSIMSSGVDIMREPPLIGDGAEIRDVHIVLSTDVGRLAGRVVASGGVPLGGATVMLVAADQNGQRLSRGRLLAVTGSDGRFMIGAAPGEYQVVVWTGRPPSSEEALRRLAESAPRVTLQAGEHKVLELIAPDEK